MELKATFLLLILVTVIRARPNDNDLDDEKAQCSIFEDKQTYPDPKLNFRFDHFFLNISGSRFPS